MTRLLLTLGIAAVLSAPVQAQQVGPGPGGPPANDPEIGIVLPFAFFHFCEGVHAVPDGNDVPPRCVVQNSDDCSSDLADLVATVQLMGATLEDIEITKNEGGIIYDHPDGEFRTEWRLEGNLMISGPESVVRSIQMFLLVFPLAF